MPGRNKTYLFDPDDDITIPDLPDENYDSLSLEMYSDIGSDQLDIKKQLMFSEVRCNPT